MDAADRVLEFALGQHFAPAPPMDLAQEVAKRWAQGEQGSLAAWELEELRESAEWANSQPGALDLPHQGVFHGGRPLLRSRAFQWICLVAALLLLVLGIRYWSMPSPPQQVRIPEQSPWIVQLESPVRLLRGADFKELSSSIIESGDIVLISEGAHDFELGDGLQAQLEAPALFSLSPAPNGLQIAVLAGRMNLTSEAELDLVVNGSHIRAAAGSAFQVGPPTLDASELPRLSYANSVGLYRQQHGPRDDLFISLKRGELQLSRADQALILRPDSMAMVATRDLVIEHEVWQKVQFRIEEILPQGSRRMAALTFWEMERAVQQSRQLADLLEVQSGLWGLVEKAMLGAAEQGQLNRVHASVLLDLLVSGDEPESLVIARRLWLQSPETFYPMHIAALAARGLFEFEREVLAQLDFHRLDPEDQVPGMLLYAICAAMQGDARGRDLLERAIQDPSEEQIQSGEFLLVALALENLGVASAWELALDMLQRVVGEMLEQGDLGKATQHVQRLEALANFKVDPSGYSWSAALGVPGKYDPAGDGLGTSEIELRQRLALALGR